MSHQLLHKIESTEQIEEVCRMAKEIWIEHYTSIIGRDQVDYMIEKYQSPNAVEKQLREGYSYYFIMNEDQPAGYAAIKPEEGKLFLSKIYVHQSARRKGLAGRTLNTMEEIARELGLKAIYLTVNKQNEQSITAYEHMGFVVTQEVVTDIGYGYVMDDYIMELNV